MLEHWIIDPVAQVRFRPKKCDFFFSLICYALFLLQLSCHKIIYTQFKARFEIKSNQAANSPPENANYLPPIKNVGSKKLLPGNSVMIDQADFH